MANAFGVYSMTAASFLGFSSVVHTLNILRLELQNARVVLFGCSSRIHIFLFDGLRPIALATVPVISGSQRIISIDHLNINDLSQELFIFNQAQGQAGYPLRTIFFLMDPTLLGTAITFMFSTPVNHAAPGINWDWVTSFDPRTPYLGVLDTDYLHHLLGHVEMGVLRERSVYVWWQLPHSPILEFNAYFIRRFQLMALQQTPFPIFYVTWDGVWLEVPVTGIVFYLFRTPNNNAPAALNANMNQLL